MTHPDTLLPLRPARLRPSSPRYHGQTTSAQPVADGQDSGRERVALAHIRPGATPCLACLMDTQQQGLEETCDTFGVLGPIVNLIASLEAAEAMKLLAGQTGYDIGVCIKDIFSDPFGHTDFFGIPPFVIDRRKQRKPVS